MRRGLFYLVFQLKQNCTCLLEQFLREVGK